ncbi:hypothetical protein AB0D78_30005 [Streptomyces avermitilis]|uniref:hypothetical protein n=1 Tax=Streptomyces avermitilis TaxID=33903 RepID=UPI0033D49828
MRTTGEGPVQRLGNILAVREGGDRVIWRRAGTHGWRAENLWPRPEDEADLGAHMARQDPLLVIFERRHTVVPVLSEEMLLAQPALRVRTEFSDAPGDDIGEITVPFLDWLPSDLRERGIRFAAGTERVLSGPSRLRPRVLLESRDEAVPHVRFVRLAAPIALSASDLAALAGKAFGDEEEPSYSSCPYLHRVTVS